MPRYVEHTLPILLDPRDSLLDAIHRPAVFSALSHQWIPSVAACRRMKYAWREKEYSHRASVNHVAVLSLPASCESIVLLTFFASWWFLAPKLARPHIYIHPWISVTRGARRCSSALW